VPGSGHPGGRPTPSFLPAGRHSLKHQDGLRDLITFTAEVRQHDPDVHALYLIIVIGFAGKYFPILTVFFAYGTV
jgi:hypothetical protein